MIESRDPAAPVTGIRMDAAAVGGTIYVIGGRVLSSFSGGRSLNIFVNEAYDVATDSWQTKAPLPTPRCGTAKSVVNCRIHVLGGEGWIGDLTTMCGLEYTCCAGERPVGTWPAITSTCTDTEATREGRHMPTAHLHGDLQMYYEDDDFTDPWSKPETVILHHGNAKNAGLWYAWVPLLAGNYGVIRVDARGFGRSSIPVLGYNWSLEGFATDLVHVMDHLGIDKAHVVGETISGTIALQFAYQFPDRLHTVTTCTSLYKFRGVRTFLDYYHLVKEQGVEAWVRQTAHRRLEPGKSDPRHSEWYIQQMSQTARHVMLETLAYLSTVDLTPILPQITTPALVIVGERSAMNTPDRTRNLAELLPNGTLVEVSGASGYVQHFAPAQCVAIWRDLVRAVK